MDKSTVCIQLVNVFAFFLIILNCVHFMVKLSHYETLTIFYK